MPHTIQIINKLSISLFFIVCVVSTNSIYADDFGCDLSSIPENLIQLGCGCIYYKESQSESLPILSSELDWKYPTMFIDGELVEVKLSESDEFPGSLKIGDTFSLVFTHKNTSFTFNNEITFMCTEESVGCEVDKFSSTLEIDCDECKPKVHSIKGDCGC